MSIEEAPEKVSDDTLDDLRRRLRTRRPIGQTGAGDWSRGTDPAYLDRLLDYWMDHYDWRVHEERIRAQPWARVLDDRHGSRAIHRRVGADAPTVVLLHGWPDSILRYERVLPLLTDLNVVVPCLPGFPFAPGVPGGMSLTAMVPVIANLMSALGHERYVVSGGDLGAGVAARLAAAHPENVTALHLTNIPFSQVLALPPAELNDEERRYLEAGRDWQATEGGYALEQSTRPHSLAPALGDSPTGLAAWVVEKLRAWSDCGGDVEAVFPRDDLLTWLTAYWTTGTIGSSFTPYADPGEPIGPVTVPTAVAQFPKDLIAAPRSHAERLYDIEVWEEHPVGGHFPAWEVPELFVAGLRSCIALGA